MGMKNPDQTNSKKYKLKLTLEELDVPYAESSKEEFFIDYYCGDGEKYPMFVNANMFLVQCISEALMKTGFDVGYVDKESFNEIIEKNILNLYKQSDEGG